MICVSDIICDLKDGPGIDPGPRIFLEDRKWKKHIENPGVLLVSPETLENKYFKDVYHWSSFFRLSKSSPYKSYLQFPCLTYAF